MSKTTKSLWLHRVGPLGLAGALVLPLSITAAQAAEAEKQSVYEVRHNELLNSFKEVETQRRAAMDLADEGKFSEAVAALEAVSKKLAGLTGDLAASKRAEISKNIAAVKGLWSATLMQEAHKLAKANKFDEAIAKAQLAQQLTPTREYAGFISACQKMRAAADFKKETSLATVSPDYQSRQKQIDLDLREAKLFFRNKRYDSARNRLERVLLIDPFNTEAMDMLALIYDRLYNIGRNRSDEVEKFWLGRNMWEWAEPIETVQVDTTLNRSAEVRERGASDLYNRLERIVFPSVPLKNSTVKDVINYLNEKSRLYDKENKEGVTIIDNLPPEVKRRKVSLELGAMPLLDIIRYFSMASGLSYGFRDNRVVFGNVDTLSTEYFPVRGDIIAEIIDSQTTKPTSSGLKGPEESGGDGAPLDNKEPAEETEAPAETAAPAESGDSENQRISAALKAYFAARWVTFENGANIIYSPRGERLMVRNTPENLRRMDALLRQLNALDQPMIMVEAKLIELTDTNLNELGFEWAFSAQRTKDNGWKLGTNDPTRHGNAEGMFRVIKDLKIFPNFGEKIFGSDLNVDMSLSVNAVAQNRKAEVLSSPRILSISGPKTPAKIQMTEKTYFITEWEEPDVEVEDGNISIDTEDPEWDEAVDLGVTFEVTPVVESDNYLITLNNIKPVFLSHVGDYTKNMTYVITTRAPDGTITNQKSRTVEMRMPEFARREMTTSVSIYDGETVLIGGMADNEVTARDDKWPILGDIPLIGNLFRDQQNNVRNTSLLIFISARLVNAKGEPWDPTRASRNRGMIKFNR